MNPDENNTNQEGAVPPVAPDAPVTSDVPVTPATPETPPTPPETSPEMSPAPEAPVVPPVPEAPAPETPAEPEAPNLDQVAADLANAAPADVAPDTTPAEAPIAPAMPETTPEATPETAPVPPVAPVTPEVPTTPETPVAPPVSEAPIAPGPVAPEVPPVTPESVPEAPAPDASAPEASAAPQEDSYSTTSANFVDDAQNPEGQPAENASPENEEPLVPAEPVPGSIGSALAYSDTAPNHAVPIGKASKFKLSFGKKSATAPAAPDASAELAGTTKPGRKPLTKENLKLLIAIIGGVTLVAVVAVVIFFILNSGSKTSTTKPAENNDTPTNTVSSLTCTLSGKADVFDAYDDVVSGSSQIIAMYSNDALSSYGTTLELTFSDEESAKNAQLTERNLYSSKVKNAGLTEDPFTSSFDTSGKTVTVTHQAEGDDIDTKSAKVLGFYVIKGEPQTDIDTLLDSYETDGYTCVQK